MKVLDLPGPQFLVLYAVVVIATCGAVKWLLREWESHPAGHPLRVRDPYEIAYLRGGTQELVKVAVLALMRRGLLGSGGESLQAVASAAELTTASIERAILAACRVPVPAHALADVASVKAAGRSYQRALAAKRLVPDEATLRARIAGAAGALALLAGFALLKIVHAISTGHSNILLLLASVVVAAVLLFKIAFAPRTANGDRALTHLATLFSRVKTGPWPAHAEQLDEALLLAAVYGDYARPGSELTAWRRLFPAPNKKGTGGGDSGSSCSGGCGSGCGGGGGCGGCGS